MPAVRVVALGGCGGLLSKLGLAHLPLHLLESGGDRFRSGLRLMFLGEGRVSYPLVLRVVNHLLVSLLDSSWLLLLGGLSSLDGFGVLVALMERSLLLFLGGLLFLLFSGGILLLFLLGCGGLFFFFLAGSVLFLLFFGGSSLLFLFFSNILGTTLLLILFFLFVDLISAFNSTVWVVCRMRALEVNVLMIAIGRIVTVSVEISGHIVHVQVPGMITHNIRQNGRVGLNAEVFRKSFSHGHGSLLTEASVRDIAIALGRIIGPIGRV